MRVPSRPGHRTQPPGQCHRLARAEPCPDEAVLGREGALFRAHFIQVTAGRQPRSDGWKQLSARLQEPVPPPAAPALFGRQAYRLGVLAPLVLCLVLSIWWYHVHELDSPDPAALSRTAWGDVAAAEPRTGGLGRAVTSTTGARGSGAMPSVPWANGVDATDWLSPVRSERVQLAQAARSGAVHPRDLLPTLDRDEYINPFGVRPPRPAGDELSSPLRPGHFRFASA